MTEIDLLDTPQAGPRVVRGGVLRVLAYGAGSALSLVGIAVVTRHLGTADFGRYQAIFSLVTILMGLTDAGTVALGIREHAVRDVESGRRFLANLQGLRLVLGTLGVGAGLLFAVAAGYDDQMIAGAALAGLGLLVFIVWGTVQIPLQSRLHIGWVAGLEFFRAVVTVLFLLAGVLVGAGVAGLLAVSIPTSLALLAVTFPRVRGLSPLLPAANVDEWRELLRVTLPFAAATAAGIAYAHVTVLVMSIVSTTSETGLFGAAFRVYFVIAAVPGLLVATALPLLARASRDDRDRLRYALQRLLEGVAVGGVGAALVVALGAPAIIAVVAGSQFSEAEPVLRIMSLALLGTFLIAVGSYGLLAAERYRALLIVNLTGLALSAALALALAPSMGAKGAATAVAVGDLTLAALQLFILRRDVGLRAGLLPRVIPAGLLGGAVVFLGLPAVPAAVLAAVVFAGMALAAGAVPPELLPSLRGQA